MAKRRRRIRWGCLLILVFLTGGIAGGAVWILADNWRYLTGVVSGSESGSGQVVTRDQSTLNVLAVGQGEITDGPYDDGSDRQADFIALAMFDLRHNLVRIINIPRNTVIGSDGPERSLGRIYASLGIEGLQTRVAELLGVETGYYVIADCQGLRSFVDAMGGVEIFVDNDMRYSDPAAGLEINLGRGYRRLNGSEADSYLRYRSDGLGDIGRVQRQNKFIRGWEQQFFSWSTLWRAPMIVSSLHQSLVTDLDDRTMLRLLYVLAHYRSMDLPVYVLPGRTMTVNRFSCWRVDREASRQWAAQLL
ncbi:MAG: LCP family protein [Negativicutes bacterium]|nr:LCP family protein [Negativicutes bacterium]